MRYLFVISGVIFLVSVLVGAFWGFVEYREYTLRDSGWILRDMWGDDYITSRGGRLEEFDRANLRSLAIDEKSRSDALAYVWKNRCRDDGERCYVTAVAAANLLMASSEVDSGLRALVEAQNRVDGRDFCPIAYELSILSYKIRTISLEDSARSVDIALGTMRKIRRDGGLFKSLRVESCQRLSREKPEYFRSYALMIARLMSLADGSAKESSDLIYKAIGKGVVYE